MNAPAERIVIAVGTPRHGGIYLGNFFVGHEAFELIKAPKAEGEIVLPWGPSRKKVDGALSAYDGLANTRAMAEAGSKLGKWALDLRIGGFDDWYLWSRGEALLGYAAALEGNEAFERDVYWTSTQYAGDAEGAWYQYFEYGTQGYWLKSDKDRAVAVRRVPIR
jgi:hypothetical protein